MKIYSNQADSYINNLKNNSSLVTLIYGPDQGAVHNYRNKLINKLNPANDPLALVEFTAEQIKHEASALLNEINSPSFFSSKKIIVINGVNSAVAEIIGEASKNLPPDISIIITAEELGRESKMRSYFENHPIFPTIICYKEDSRAVKNYVIDKLRQNNIKTDPATLEFLCANLGDDKQITINELEKILIYLGEQKFLSFEEVTWLLADNSELALNDIAYNVSLKAPNVLEKSLQKAFAEHISTIAIIRACYSHFNKIAIVQNHVNQGLNLDSAVKTLRPPIFFKQVDQFKASVNKWSIQQIASILNRLLKLELSLKADSLDSELLCHKELISLATS